MLVFNTSLKGKFKAILCTIMKLYYTAITAQHFREHHEEIGVTDFI